MFQFSDPSGLTQVADLQDVGNHWHRLWKLATARRHSNKCANLYALAIHPTGGWWRLCRA